MTVSRQVCRQMPSQYGQLGLNQSETSQADRTVLDVLIAAVIHVFCEADPSLGTAIVNGLLAWATVLGGCTVLFSGLPATVALFIPSRPASLARRINQGLGIGLLAGMGGGLLMFFVFIAKVIP